MEATLTYGLVKTRTRIPQLVLGLCLLAVTPAVAWPWSVNRYDKQELKNGRWRTYHDEQKKVLHYKGRYAHGKEVGIWKTYTPEGALYFKERISRKKKEIKTIYYHPNGKISHQGMALLETTQTGGLHYFWHGPWQYFDSSGKPTKVKYYVKGKTKEELASPAPKQHDEFEIVQQ